MDSRSGLNYTIKYPPVEKALKGLKHEVIIDGEVVVFNQEEKPDFDALQLYDGNESPIMYCVFDLLWIDGQDLRGFPLTERKELLKILVKTMMFSVSAKVLTAGRRCTSKCLT
ncbi:MAG: ligD [Sphingobacterium sp.]|nr:ligD [Sphingobacterium sp.]